MRTSKKITAGLSLALAGAFALTACTSSADTSSDDMDTSAPAPVESETAMPMDDAYANLVGPGCMDYDEAVPSGPGSIEQMAMEPVATAASGSPVLTTLVAAVSGQLNPDVNLVDTLNGGEFTVFAPVDDAFGKIDAATLETLKTDSDLLTSILTYHVVPGQVMPSDISGMHTTVQGADLEVTGSGDEWMVNGESMVVCGGVETQNATVYLIDTVLMPPAA